MGIQEDVESFFSWFKPKNNSKVSDHGGSSTTDSFFSEALAEIATLNREEIEDFFRDLAEIRNSFDSKRSGYGPIYNLFESYQLFNKTGRTKYLEQFVDYVYDDDGKLELLKAEIGLKDSEGKENGTIENQSDAQTDLTEEEVPEKKEKLTIEKKVEDPFSLIDDPTSGGSDGGTLDFEIEKPFSFDSNSWSLTFRTPVNSKENLLGCSGTTLWRELEICDVKLSLPRGLVAIYGESGSGKSTFCRYLSLRLQIPYCSFLEPDHDSISSVEGLLEILNDSSHKEVVIDSARFFMYGGSTKSSALPGGINGDFFNMLARLSSDLAKDQRTIFLAINPLVGERDAVANSRIETSINGSCSGFFRMSRGLTFFSSRVDNDRTREVSFNPLTEMVNANVIRGTARDTALSSPDLRSGKTLSQLDQNTLFLDDVLTLS